MNEKLTPPQNNPEIAETSSLLKLPIKLGNRAIKGVENYFLWRRNEHRAFTESHNSRPHREAGYYVDAGDWPRGLDDQL
jgi:hypothetical protein